MGLSVLEARLAGDAIRHLLALTPRLLGPNLVGPDPIHVSLAHLPLPGFFTFTRGGTLPYFRIADDADGERWEQATDADQPRIASPDGKLSRRGLLNEPRRTNRGQRNREIDLAPWTNINVPTVNADARVSPDGTSNADDIVDDSAAMEARQQTAMGFGDSDEITASVFGRSVAGNDGGMRFNNVTASFDVSLNSLIWTRIKTTQTLPGGVGDGNACFIQLRPAISGGASTGTTSYWMPQVEVGSYVTSPIVTVGAAAVRNGDVATLSSADLSAWIRPESGRVRKIWIPEADSSAAADWRIFLLTALDYFRIRGTRVVQLVNAGVEVDSSPALTWTANSTVFVFDFVWGGGTATLRIFKDGALEDVLTGAWTPPTFGADFWLGVNSAGGAQAPGIFPALVIG